MEANWNEELYFLEEYKKAIAVQLNWGNSQHWRHSDFVNLSEKIFEKTGVLLSNTTLKRLWGKLRYDSLPTPNTLNTLAQYLDYENWLAFKTEVEQKQSLREQVHSSVPQQPSLKPVLKTTKFNRWASPRLLIGFAGVGGILVLLVGFILKNPKQGFTPEQLAKVKFSSQPIAEGVPNTVIFNYDLGDIKSDDIQIQQSWDSTKRFRITEITNEAASTYYRPGYWRAKLIVDGQIVKEHDVFIKSKGWLVTQDLEPKPRYFSQEELIQDGYLGVDSTILAQSFDAGSAEPAWLTYHYIEDFGDLHSSKFTFKAAVRNTYDRGNGICQETRILILCENGFIGIPLSIPGCVGDLRLRIFDQVEDGDSHDLSAFGRDLFQWQRVRCEVRDQQLRLLINEKVVREVPVPKDAGRIVGIRIGFQGAGEIDDIMLFDGNTGKIAYHTSFNPK